MRAPHCTFFATDVCISYCNSKFLCCCVPAVVIAATSHNVDSVNVINVVALDSFFVEITEVGIVVAIKVAVACFSSYCWGEKVCG